MAVWERKDGTKTEFESWKERDTRLSKLAVKLYQSCKESNVTVGELKRVTEILLSMAEHLPL